MSPAMTIDILATARKLEAAGVERRTIWGP